MSQVKEPVDTSQQESVNMSQVQEPVNTKQVQELVDTSQIQEDVDTSQVQELVDTSQVTDHVDESQVHKPVDTNQVQEPVDTNQVQEPVDTSQVQEPVDTSQVQEPVDTSQVQEPVDTSQVQEPVDTSQIQEPVDTSQVQEPVDTSQVQEQVDTSQELLLYSERLYFISNLSSTKYLQLVKNGNTYTVEALELPPDTLQKAAKWTWEKEPQGPVETNIGNVQCSDLSLDIKESDSKVIASKGPVLLPTDNLAGGCWRIGKKFGEKTMYIAIDQNGVVYATSETNSNINLKRTPAPNSKEKVFNLAETTTTTATEHIGSTRPTSPDVRSQLVAVPSSNGKSPSQRRCCCVS